MRSLIHTLILFLVCASSPALADDVDAGTLAAACQKEEATDGEAGKISYCLMFFTGYIEGNAAGAERGLRTAFIHDRENSETVHGIQNLTMRVSLLRRKAHCLPPQATPKQVAEVFLQFVKAHPDKKEQPYQHVITEAVESYYCEM